MATKAINFQAESVIEQQFYRLVEALIVDCLPDVCSRIPRSQDVLGYALVKNSNILEINSLEAGLIVGSCFLEFHVILKVRYKRETGLRAGRSSLFGNVKSVGKNSRTGDYITQKI